MMASYQENSDKPRQCVKKQRHYFADSGPYSQGYGLSSNHVQLWELDHKEGWVLKDWCLQTVVLEKTLESLLDSKAIKPVNLKGNQSWILIGRTDAEAPILWPPDVNSQLIETTWCWERLKAEEGDRRWDGWTASPMQWPWPWANSRKYWGKGKPCMLRCMELQRVGHNWATEHNNLVQTLSYSGRNQPMHVLQYW